MLDYSSTVDEIIFDTINSLTHLVNSVMDTERPYCQFRFSSSLHSRASDSLKDKSTL